MKNKCLKNLKGLHMITFGGCSIGMSLCAYSVNGNLIIVDMGIGFLDGSNRSVLVPDPSVLVEMKHKIKGIFLTHMHEDHIGAIPYIWPLLNKPPIYAMPIVCEMLKEKLRDFDVKNMACSKVSPYSDVKVGDFSVQYIPVAHSTPEACSLFIKTQYGNILHSGDWRFDDSPVLGSSTSIDDFKKIGEQDVLAFVCESTNAHRQEPMGSESLTRGNLINLVKKYDGDGVVITCFASNVARLETCYYAAKESGRQMAIMGRSLRRIEKVARTCGYLKDIPQFLNEKQAAKMDAKDVLLVCTGSQGEPGAALSKLAYSDRNTEFKLKRGYKVIFSSRAIPGNEKAIIALQGALISRGIEVISDEDSTLHASGHASASELVKMYDLVRPNCLIPVHGEIGNLHNHAMLASSSGIKNVLVPHEGAVIRLKKDDFEIEDSVQVDTLLVDGIQLVPLNGDIRKERGDLLESGVVVASLTVNKKKKSVNCDDISFVGIFEKTEREEKQQIISDIVASIAANCSNDDMHDNVIEKTATKIIKDVIANERGLRPTVIVHIINVR